jgi:hypothetical protein
LTDDIARLVRGVINLEQSGRIVLLLDPLRAPDAGRTGTSGQFQAATAQADV